jgi:hypothetical protein
VTKQSPERSTAHDVPSQVRGAVRTVAPTPCKTGPLRRDGSAEPGLQLISNRPRLGHNPRAFTATSGHSRARNPGRPAGTFLLVGRLPHHRPCKLVIKLRAPHVHHRTANDGHRRVPAVNLRSRLPTIISGFTQVRGLVRGLQCGGQGRGRTADLPLFRGSIPVCDHDLVTITQPSSPA